MGTSWQALSVRQTDWVVVLLSSVASWHTPSARQTVGVGAALFLSLLLLGKLPLLANAVGVVAIISQRHLGYLPLPALQLELVLFIIVSRPGFPSHYSPVAGSPFRLFGCLLARNIYCRRSRYSQCNFPSRCLGWFLFLCFSVGGLVVANVGSSRWCPLLDAVGNAAGSLPFVFVLCTRLFCVLQTLLLAPLLSVVILLLLSRLVCLSVRQSVC